MVTREKQALKAIHRLLIQGRWLAFEGMPSQELGEYFDEVEGLMGLVISWQTDMSEAFEAQLREICERVRASHIFLEFKR